MLARQLAYITYVRGSMSTLQILLFPCFYSVWSPTLSREEPILCVILALHWIRRVKDHMRRKHLLSLPIVQDEGRLFYAMPNRIATIPMAVNDGFSYNYGNGNMYEHYHYDRVGVYDGEYASFSGKKGYVALATLPRSFWGEEETISHQGRDVSIDYVVDEDGKCYYIKSRQL